MCSIEAVIFDLGRVMVQLDFSRGLLAHLSTGNSAADADATIRQIGDNPLFREFCAGQLTPEDFHSKLMHATGQTMDYDQFCALWCDIFSMDEAMARLFQDTAEHRKVGILSDTDPLHWTHLRATYPVLATVKQPTLSYEVGTTKPDPVIYIAAAQHVNTEPSQCLFIDDMQRNVEGAIRAGMNAIRFENPQQIRKALAERGVL